MPTGGHPRCETTGCCRTRCPGERFCFLCRGRILKRLREEGYLTPLPLESPREPGEVRGGSLRYYERAW
jgi:hypothetical protein